MARQKKIEVPGDIEIVREEKAEVVQPAPETVRPSNTESATTPVVNFTNRNGDWVLTVNGWQFHKE